MRNRLLISLALLLPVIGMMAQAPQGLNYQAVARNSSGAVLVNQAVGIELTIISGTPTGTTVYQETNTATTNEFGLFSVVIGGGTPVTGTLASVNWAAGPMYLQVALDPTGGTNYTNYGTPTQLQSVPYALNAASSSQWYNYGNSVYNADTTGSVVVTSSAPDPFYVIGTGEDNYTEYFTLGRYRGYLGVYNDTAGFDVGTGAGNTVGTFNLVTDATPRVTITGAGLTGIGTTTPTELLTVNGDVIISGPSGSSANLYLGYATDSATILAASYGLSINATHLETVGIFMDEANKYIEPEYSGTTELGSSTALWKAVYSTNGTLQTSDARKKTNIQNLNMGLKEVMALRPVTYEWINPAEGDDGKIGFIAQEVEKVVPQAVVHDYISDKEIEVLKARNKPVPEIRDPYAMNYSEMIPVLTKAIQEQQAMIIQLQKEVELLKGAR